MTDKRWKRYVDGSELFQLDLPSEAELELNTFEAGEHYFTYVPLANVGSFTILWESTPGHSPQDMLDLENNLGIAITIEINEMEAREGKQVYHLRYLTDEMRGPEIVQDPVTEAIIDLPVQRIVEIADYYFWQGEKEALRAGFRVHADAPPELIDTFGRILASFELLRPLP